MSAQRIQKPSFRTEFEKILSRCDHQVKQALQSYRKELVSMVEDVKDAVQIIEADQPFC